MGRAKEWMMEQDAQGFISKGTRVCQDCIEDEFLRRLIKEEGDDSNRECSYCGQVPENRVTLSFDAFMRHVLNGIESEWGEPNDEGVGWEGGWVGNVIDSYDIINDEVDIGFCNENLRDDVLYSISDRQWCQRNFYELPLYKALAAGWDEFSKVVKYESRYVFQSRDDVRSKWRGNEEIRPSEFLDALGSIISQCGLYRALEPGAVLYRLRLHSKDISVKKASDLGAPPPKAAIFSNRMSAAGISAFYGAFDKDTAIAETTYAGCEGQMATMGKFEVLHKLNVVDLTKIPAIPSIFEPNTTTKRHGILFLRGFLRDFTKPVTKDGREHIEYVPTQIVAEHLRYIHRGEGGCSIDGVIYNSARDKSGVACVLFVGQEHTCDKGADEAGKVLRLVDVESSSVS